jgi:Putative Actinobacterial Holin-X, holin superfamily III
METTPNLIESLLASIESYIKTTYELTKLKALENITFAVTSVVSRMVIFVVLLLFMLFSSIGAALWLGDYLGKAYYGFFSVAAFYLVLGVVLHVFLLKWIKASISNLLVSAPI